MKKTEKLKLKLKKYPQLKSHCFHMHVSVTDGGSLPAGRMRKIGRGNLEIRNVGRRDAGLYRCSLTDAPDVFAEAVLSVHGQWKTEHLFLCAHLILCPLS